MDNAVLISIRPEWVDKIASGQKTVEVRKNRPKLGTPFKCYIYRTKGGGVIGEFICDKVSPMSVKYANVEKAKSRASFYEETRLTDKQIIDYLGNGKTGYGWHISKLKIYEEPMDLCDFSLTCKRGHDCGICPCYNREHQVCFGRNISRPPQSWCYVEVV